jgi:glycine/D-amino acid oxidase-like deaminating enzyme
MSESTAEPLRRGLVWDVTPDPAGLLLPRRVTTERRKAADAVVVAAAAWTPSWAAEPTLDFGSAVPLEDDAA